MVIVVMIVDILWGYIGYFMFGQLVFFGIGVYVVGLVFIYGGFSFVMVMLVIGIIIVVVVVVVVLVGWLLFYCGVLLFFVIVILLVLFIVLIQLLLLGGSWIGFSFGLIGYDSFDFFFDVWYWILGGMLVVVVLVGCLLVCFDVGCLFVVICDNEQCCSYLGINILLVKIVLLVVMVVLVGLVGFGYGVFSGVVVFELVGFVLGMEFIIWVVLGGCGSLWGLLIGVVLINVVIVYFSSSMFFVW